MQNGHKSENSSAVAEKFTSRGFETVEELQESFSASTKVIAPHLTMGGGRFLKEFATWVGGYTHPHDSIDVFLPPDPAHAIAFPTAGEFLNSAVSLTEQLGRKAELQGVLNEFGLKREVCDQPTHTLSGGERALVALAKAKMLLPFAEDVVISNPAKWLYPKRRYLIGEALSHINSAAKRAEFLYLHGEPSSPVEEKPALSSFEIAHPQWELEFDQLEVTFPSVLPDTDAQPRKLRFIAAEKPFKLRAPTLITGDNGVGKSTFAKVLSNVVPLHAGKLRVKARGFQDATCRLVFQDVPEQLFALKPRDHLDFVFEYDTKLREKAWELFERIQNRIREITGGPLSTVTLGTDAEPSSLLQAKILLAAERLVSSAGILICDEPTWGLSETAGAAFVAAVCEEGGKRDVGLVLISHDDGLASRWFGSRLHFTNNSKPNEVSIKVLDIGTVSV